MARPKKNPFGEKKNNGIGYDGTRTNNPYATPTSSRKRRQQWDMANQANLVWEEKQAAKRRAAANRARIEQDRIAADNEKNNKKAREAFIRKNNIKPASIDHWYEEGGVQRPYFNQSKDWESQGFEANEFGVASEVFRNRKGKYERRDPLKTGNYKIDPKTGETYITLPDGTKYPIGTNKEKYFEAVQDKAVEQANAFELNKEQEAENKGYDLDKKRAEVSAQQRLIDHRKKTTKGYEAGEKGVRKLTSQNKQYDEDYANLQTLEEEQARLQNEKTQTDYEAIKQARFTNYLKTRPYTGSLDESLRSLEEYEEKGSLYKNIGPAGSFYMAPLDQGTENEEKRPPEANPVNTSEGKLQVTPPKDDQSDSTVEVQAIGESLHSGTTVQDNKVKIKAHHAENNPKDEEAQIKATEAKDKQANRNSPTSEKAQAQIPVILNAPDVSLSKLYQSIDELTNTDEGQPKLAIGTAGYDGSNISVAKRQLQEEAREYSLKYIYQQMLADLDNDITKSKIHTYLLMGNEAGSIFGLTGDKLRPQTQGAYEDYRTGMAFESLKDNPTKIKNWEKKLIAKRLKEYEDNPPWRIEAGATPFNVEPTAEWFDQNINVLALLNAKKRMEDHYQQDRDHKGTEWQHVEVDERTGLGFSMRLQEGNKGKPIFEYKIDGDLGDSSITKVNEYKSWDKLTMKEHMDFVSENLAVMRQDVGWFQDTFNRLVKKYGQGVMNLAYLPHRTFGTYYWARGTEELKKRVNDQYDKVFPTSVASDFKARTSTAAQTWNGLVDGFAQLFQFSQAYKAGGFWGAYSTNFATQSEAMVSEAFEAGMSPKGTLALYVNASLIAGVDSLADRFLIKSGSVFKNALPKSAYQKLVATTGGRYLTATGGLLAKGGTEGGTEVVQTFWENVYAQHSFDPDRKYSEGGLVSFYVGALLGTTMGTRSFATDISQGKQRAKDVQVVAEELKKIEDAEKGGDTAKEELSKNADEEVNLGDIIDARNSVTAAHANKAASLLNIGVAKQTVARILANQNISPETQEAILLSVSEGGTGLFNAIAVGNKYSQDIPLLSEENINAIFAALEVNGEATLSEKDAAVAALEGYIFIAREAENILENGKATLDEYAQPLIEIGLATQDPDGGMKVNASAAKILPHNLAERVRNEADVQARGKIDTNVESAMEGDTATDSAIDENIEDGRKTISAVADDVLNEPTKTKYEIRIVPKSDPENYIALTPMELSSVEKGMEIGRTNAKTLGIVGEYEIEVTQLSPPQTQDVPELKPAKRVDGQEKPETTEQTSDLTDEQRTTLDEEQAREADSIADSQAQREAQEQEANIGVPKSRGEFGQDKVGTGEFGQELPSTQNRADGVDIKDDQETIQTPQGNVQEDINDPTTFTGEAESVRQREKNKEEEEKEPIQEQTSPNEERVLTPQVETPVGKPRKTSDLVDNFEQDPVIAAIIDEGGLISKSRAQKENKEKYEQNKDLWDDVPYLGNPALNGIYSKTGGMMPDQMLRALIGRGLFGEYDSLSKMYDAIERASNSAKSITANQKTQEEDWSKEERLANLPTQLKTSPNGQNILVDSLNKSQPWAQKFIPVDIDSVDDRINLPFIFALEQRTGRRIILVEPANKDDAGVKMSGTFDNGTIFINLDGDKAPLATAMHEFMHSVRRESPELYNQFKRAVINSARSFPELVTTVTGQYLEAYNGNWSLVEEEAIANIAGDLAMDRKFWNKFLAKEPKISEKIVGSFVSFLDGLRNKFRRTPRKGRTWEAVDALSGLDEVRASLADVITQSQNYNRIVGSGKTFPVLGDLKMFALDPDQGSFDFDSAPARKAIKRTQQQLFNFESKRQPRKTLPKSEPELPKPTGEIKDFGQKIGGAKKDIYAAYLEKMESFVGDDASITMAKDFPMPNYKQLAKEGVSIETLASIAAIRDSIDAKPKGKFKLRNWAETFRTLRGIATQLLTEPDSEVANAWKEILSREAGVLKDIKSYSFVKRESTQEDYDLRKKAGIVPSNGVNSQLGKIASKTMLYRALGLPDFTKAKKWGIGYFRNVNYDKQGEPLDKPANAYVAKYNKRAKITAPKSFKTDPQEAIMEIADQIKRVMKTDPDPDKEDRRRKPYGVYQSRLDQSIYIAKKVGRRVVRLKDGFKSVTEAHAYLRGNFDEIEQLFNEKKEVKLRREDNRPREGERLRKPQENIDPDQFMSRFGFRGVEFGNYVENKRRQQNLNETYDALNDLGAVLNIPTEALSLDGTLALAFGARGSGGKGAASAHYEPIKIAINLTKKKGAGSLAHEWFHGLDNYYSKLNEKDKTDVGASGYITQKISVKEGGTRMYPASQYVDENVIMGFVDLMSQIEKSDFKKRAEKFDEARTEDYYSTNIELAARAFEGYVVNKLSESGITNDFLANIDPRGGAYPTSQEQTETFTPLFDHLFSQMSYAKTDRGTKLFALDPETKRGIINRISPRGTPSEDSRFVEVNVKDFDKLFKNDTADTYIGKGGEGGIANRYEAFKEYLGTNLPIAASEAFLKIGRDGKLASAGFENGRHRYAVLRDLGLRSIKMHISGDAKALKKAEDEGLISEELITQEPARTYSPKEIEDAIKKSPTKRFAIDPETEAEYLRLAEEPDNNYWSLTKLLDRAAKIAGYKFKGWHGTPDGRFLDSDPVFRPKEWADTGVHWFAEDYNTATTYADDTRAFDYQNAEPRTDYYYIKIDNPYMVDGEGAKWRSAQGAGRTKNVIEKAIDAGNDGVIIENVRDNYQTGVVRGDKPTTTYSVFESDQIKSANPVTYDNEGNIIPLSERFNPDKADTRFALDEDPEPFYSGVVSAIRNKFPKKASIDQALAFFKPGKTAGVKKAEVDWMGLEQWILDHNNQYQKGVIKQADLFDFASLNQMNIGVAELNENSVMYSDWKQKGGENYKEFVFYLDDKASDERGTKDLYKPQHFGGIKKNILFHMRTSDRIAENGDKYLFIEEIQSDYATDYRQDSAYRQAQKDFIIELDNLVRTANNVGKEAIRSMGRKAYREHFKRHEVAVKALVDAISEWDKTSGIREARADEYYSEREGRVERRGDMDSNTLDAIRWLRIGSHGLQKEKSEIEALQSLSPEEIEKLELLPDAEKFIEAINSDYDYVYRIRRTSSEVNVKYPNLQGGVTEEAHHVNRLLKGLLTTKKLYSRLESSLKFSASQDEKMGGITPPTLEEIYETIDPEIIPSYKEFLTSLQLFPDFSGGVASLTGGAINAFDRQENSIYQKAESMEEMATAGSATNIPYFPIVNTWYEAALKHAIRLAVKNDFDGLAWATGNMQIKLYKDRLRQNVKVIKYTKQEDDTVYLKAVSVEGDGVDVGSVPLKGKQLDADSRLFGKSLENIVGKKVAEAIRSSKEDEGTHTGKDLSIGGQLHRMLYDVAAPSFLTGKKGYLKKFNAKLDSKSLLFDRAYQIPEAERIRLYNETATSRVKASALATRDGEFDEHKEYNRLRKKLLDYKTDLLWAESDGDLSNLQFDDIFALTQEIADYWKKVWSRFRNTEASSSQDSQNFYPLHGKFRILADDMGLYDHVSDIPSFVEYRMGSQPHDLVETATDFDFDEKIKDKQNLASLIYAYIDYDQRKALQEEFYKLIIAANENPTYANRVPYEETGEEREYTPNPYRENYSLGMDKTYKGNAAPRLPYSGMEKANKSEKALGEFVTDAINRDKSGLSKFVQHLDLMFETGGSFDYALPYQKLSTYFDQINDLLGTLEGSETKYAEGFNPTHAIKFTPEMKGSTLEYLPPLFALDPVEGKKLAAIKDKGEFAKALDRAPSEAILSAYDHIPATEENDERLNTLADKVEQILQPVDDPNPVSSNFKTKVASQVGKFIREGQPKQIVEDLINERQRLENYEGHPDLLAKVEDRQYEEAVMRRPKPVEKTKRQQNFINLYNKYKDNPKSSYFKAASKALEKDFGKDWKNIAEGVASDSTRYALDPENQNQDYNAKKAQQDRATAELLDTRRKVKEAKKEDKKQKRKEKIEAAKRQRKRFFSGKYDYLDFMSGTYGGSGKAGSTLRDAEYNVAKVKSAVKEYSDLLSRELKIRVGIPFWKFLSRGKRLRQFAAELHTTAARLNVESFNPNPDSTGSNFTFRGFDARMGFMPESEAKARGLVKGSIYTENHEGDTQTLKLGNYVPEMEGYLLVQRFTAEEQQRIYTDFLNKYPDLGIILERFINPLLGNARFTASSGMKTPIFNRESLKQAFGDTELGDPGFVEGYTPDVAIATILGGAALKAKEKFEKDTFKRKLGAFNLKTSGARSIKTGAAREKGQTLDIFEGFDVRALESHLERASRQNAYKLLEASTKPLPEEGLPDGHIEISKETLNGILKGMLLVMGDKSARGTALNKFWKDAVANPDLTSYTDKVLFDEKDANYDEREKKILEFLFGDKNASRFIGTDRMMDKATYETLIDNLSARHTNFDGLGRAVQTLLGQVITSYLTAPATILFNWLAPNLQAASAGAFRINKAAIYLATGVKNPEDRRRAEYELRAGLQTLKGLATRRFSNYAGINAFLSGDDYIRGKLSDEDYDKGAGKLLLEGQVGKSIKALTDRRTKYGEIVPRELFDNNTLVSGIERIEPKDSILKDLLNLKGGSAILKLAQFHEMDPTVKQNLVYASYKAHAQMAYNDAVREAKAKGQKIDTPKKKWIRDWMKTVKDTDAIHEEARGTAMLFAFDYSNIPMWLDSKHPVMQAAKPALIPFSNFIYNYGKLLTKLTPIGLIPEAIASKGKKDKLGGAEWKNAASGFSMFAIATLLWDMLGDDEEDESELKAGKIGSNMDINNKFIKKFWMMTGGKINLDEMPDVFGSKITNAVRAYFEAYGAEKASGHELWLRGRALPYLNILATQDLWIRALKDKYIKGEDVDFRDVLSETKDMAMEFVPRGPVAALFTENKYDENKTQAEEWGAFTFDIATSRSMVPASYWRFVQRLVDPIYRRKYPSDTFEFNETSTDQFINEWKRSIPFLSKTMLPAGSMKTLKLNRETQVGDKDSEEYVETTSFDHAMLQREDVKADLSQLADMGIDLSESTRVLTDKDGELVIKYPDPTTLRIVTPAERIITMLFRIESMPSTERALARTGLEDFKAMDRLIAKAVNNPYSLEKPDKKALQAWAEYTHSPEYHDSIRNIINAEGSLAERLQREESIDGLPINYDEDGKEIPLPKDFLRKVVENMSRDQYGNLVNASDNRPMNLSLHKMWSVVPIDEENVSEFLNPMNYTLENKKKSTSYKRMLPYTEEGLELPDKVFKTK